MFLLFYGPTWESVYQKSQNELKKVVNYLSLRKLLLNIKKTIFMTFTINKENVPSDKITVHYCRDKEQCNNNIFKLISKVPFTWYLGITYYESLRWNVHIDNIVMCLRISVYKFYELKDIFPTNIVRNIYLSLFQAIFQWHSSMGRSYLESY
ncbi:neuroblastoma-amplified sequence-like [Aphis craccivora]|uniref:Neuroblastoma-amplified sequence-like n=1 Tax=Aphis craccivora TaxID=307492 RepID=A0A6G0YFG0_APHCR|nr:neuroblastoma-amplified sequence-like [Aphis craccivora]